MFIILTIKLKNHDSPDLWSRTSHQELSEIMIGCAFEVYNQLGFGFLEKVYENSLEIEMKTKGILVQTPKEISVNYKGSIVGKYVSDRIVKNQIIVEVKSVRAIVEAHEVQTVNYLKATSLPLGLILNFGPNKVNIKRKVKDL